MSPWPLEGALPSRLGEIPGRCGELSCARTGCHRPGAESKCRRFPCLLELFYLLCLSVWKLIRLLLSPQRPNMTFLGPVAWGGSGATALWSPGAGVRESAGRAAGRVVARLQLPFRRARWIHGICVPEEFLRGDGGKAEPRSTVCLFPRSSSRLQKAPRFLCLLVEEVHSSRYFGNGTF